VTGVQTCALPISYKEALTNIKVAIFKETYPEDKLTEDDEDSFL
jgi:hypothetical protein